MYKIALPLLFVATTSLMACGEEEKSADTGAIDTDTETEDTNDTEGTGDTGDTSEDTNDTDDTGDTGNDTADTGENTNDTGVVDTGTIDTGNPVGPGPNAVVDFSLPDTNPASPTVGQTISPRDYLEQVSGWYFIKAT